MPAGSPNHYSKPRDTYFAEVVEVAMMLNQPIYNVCRLENYRVSVLNHLFRPRLLRLTPRSLLLVLGEVSGASRITDGMDGST